MRQSAPALIFVLHKRFGTACAHRYARHRPLKPIDVSALQHFFGISTSSFRELMLPNVSAMVPKLIALSLEQSDLQFASANSFK
jgi:hypothetical protein